MKQGDNLNQVFSFLKEYAVEHDFNFMCDEAMSNHTTMKVGGVAELVLFPQSLQTVADLFSLCQQQKLPLTVLGNGSNVLVSDAGIAGVVMVLGKDFSDIQYLGNGVLFAQAGASLTKLCRVAQQHSLKGLEFAFGIPGSVGGATYMNAGAYGGEMKDVLCCCEHVAPDGTVAVLQKEALQLSYRHSVYQKNGCVITGVSVQLAEGSQSEITAKMEDYLERRKNKQPLEFPSAGSAFKRPEGCYASVLIDECGLKGKQIGGAQVSEKHAGFLINKDNATCQDILSLAQYVSQQVLAKTNVQLELEVKVLS